jgi:hypothetical protein
MLSVSPLCTTLHVNCQAGAMAGSQSFSSNCEACSKRWAGGLSATAAPAV